VGRSEELTRLALEWLPHHRDKSPLAIIQGMAGLGKTSLAAEAINIWHTRFKWVFAFQSRPDPLTAEMFYQRLDEKLTFASRVYRDSCKKNPNFRVYLGTIDYSGEQRNESQLGIIGGELEALRIDVMQSKVSQALPNIEQRLAQLRKWWNSWQKGKIFAELPDGPAYFKWQKPPKIFVNLEIVSI